MRKVLYMALSIVMILMLLTLSCSKKGIYKITIAPFDNVKQNLNITWNEPNVNASIKPYNVKPDLSNISNSSKFEQIDSLDKYFLYKDQFIIKTADENYEQPFNIYEENDFEGIPNFITTDSMLHIYHLMYDYIIRNTERERLLDEVKVFTENAFNNSLLIYYGIEEANAKKAALKNTAFFGIAMRLLGIDLPGGIPLEASRIIDNDVKRVKVRWGSGSSEIFPYQIDYKKYIANGHYLRETEFNNYFLAMMWYGNTPLMLDTFDNETGDYKRMDEQILMSIIMSSEILGDENLKKQWDDIYRVSSMYAGKAEDVTVYDLSDIIKVMYGTKIDFNKIWDEDRIQKVYELAKQRYNLHSGETISGRISLANTNKKLQTQFRLMGQMYDIDTDVYSNIFMNDDLLVDENKLTPKGLEVPSVFGSEDALAVLTEELNQDTQYAHYPENVSKLRGIFSGISGDNPKDYSFNNSEFWILKVLTDPYKTGYPSFMTSENWSSKKLITFAGAVSDAKHATYLTAKQGEVNDDGKINKIQGDIPGYVEPDVRFYSRLEYMGRLMRECLTLNTFQNSEMYNAIDSFIDSIVFLRTISEKELENRGLSPEEEVRLRNFSSELRNLSVNMVEGESAIKHWELIPEVDRSMASVRDAYLYDNKVLQTAIGYPDLIYVVVPYKDKLYLTRGSVYSYYEFVNPVSRKLDDKSWQALIKDGKDVEQQTWIKEIRH